MKTRDRRILEHVEIDHTELDLFIADQNPSLPIGRPWLRLVSFGAASTQFRLDRQLGVTDVPWPLTTETRGESERGSV